MPEELLDRGSVTLRPVVLEGVTTGIERQVGGQCLYREFSGLRLDAGHHDYLTGVGRYMSPA